MMPGGRDARRAGDCGWPAATLPASSLSSHAMSADGIPLSDIRHSTSARFMHEDPQTPSRSEPLGNFARSLSYQSTEDSSSIRPLWRRQLFELLESPASSQAAFVIHFFITGLIILSAIVTVLETMPSFKSQASNTFFFGFETSLVALFTVEYVARCVAWSSSLRTLFRWIGCTTYAFLVAVLLLTSAFSF
jgi:potassium voltage-gated channel Shal-related subfamily D protein 2